MIDWQSRARELLQLGLTARQIFRLREEKLHERVPAILSDGVYVAKRRIDAQLDVFIEPYEWVRKSWWNSQEDGVDWANSCFAPSLPSYDQFHEENKVCKALRHDGVTWNVRLLKLDWFEKGIIVVPRQNIPQASEISRDWAIGCDQGSKKRSSLLIALNVQFVRPEEEKYHRMFYERILKEEILQGANVTFTKSAPASISRLNKFEGARPFKVYTNDPVMLHFLQQNSKGDYVLETNPYDASFWYTLTQVKFPDVPPTIQGVNQFPFESALVRKDICLVQVCRACLNNFPEAKWWALPAFDLETELAHFIDQFSGKTTWVVKPAQQARSAGIMLANNLPTALSAMRGPGGDKVAQLHVSRPMLMKKRKFDLRTLVIVKQFAAPLIAWANVKATYARVARSDFSMDKLSSKASHMTVSRYDTDANGNTDNDLPLVVPREQLLSDMFTLEQATQWKDIVEPRAWLMMKQILLGAAHWIGTKRAPSSVGACYGIDWMVDEEGFPKLIEVNFCPDMEMSRKFANGLEATILSVLTGQRGVEKGDSLGDDWISLSPV